MQNHSVKTCSPANKLLKKAGIWAAVLVFCGLLGTSSVWLQRYFHIKKTAPLKEKFGDKSEKMLALYENWANLPEHKKLEETEFLTRISAEQNRQLTEEQSQQLRADIDELADGYFFPAGLGDILYGSNWQQKVDKHRTRQKFLQTIDAASTLSLTCGIACSIGLCSLWGIKKLNYPLQIFRTAEDEYPLNASEPTASITNNNTSTGMADFFDSAPAAGSFESFFEQNNFNFEQNNFNTEPAEAASSPQSVATMIATEPVSKSLSELSQEMSAIRDFAIAQQDRVKKLQDGYDWNIIKRFCIRIIRCVDNLEEKIEILKQAGHDTSDMEDIRDELIFALESSGIEQFRPAINSEYRGQEKFLEAVRTREKTSKENKTGKIAKVVKCGYKYIVSDNEEKIVRCAQVKLFT